MPGLKASQEFLSRFSLFAPTKVSTAVNSAEICCHSHTTQNLEHNFNFVCINILPASSMHKIPICASFSSSGDEKMSRDCLKFVQNRRAQIIRQSPTKKIIFHPSKLITIVSDGIGIQFLEENGNVKVHFLVFVISSHYHQNIFPPFIDIFQLRPRSLTVTNKIEHKILSFE